MVNNFARAHDPCMKSPQRVLIENMLTAGHHSIRAIAKLFGISPARVSTINKEMLHPVNRAEVRELWNVHEVLKAPTRNNEFHGWLL